MDVGSEGSDPKSPASMLVLGLGVLSWGACVFGTCLGMGYAGPLVATAALVVAWSVRDSEDVEPRTLWLGAALALAQILAFVLALGALVLAFGGLLLLGEG